MGDRFACDRPEHPDHGSRLREGLGCDLPADDYPESGGGPACRNCSGRSNCAEKGHGHYYVGRKGKGIRTDRCPKSWAAEPIAVEAAQAYGWQQSPNGFAEWVGPHVPAVLMQAINLYAVEASWRVKHELDNPIKKPGARAPGERMGAGDGPRLRRGAG